MSKQSLSKRSRRQRNVVFYTILVIVLFINLFPLMWMLLSSFKTNAELLNMDRLINFTPTLKNYYNVFVTFDFMRPMLNSLYIGLVSTLLALLLGLPAAYAIARAKLHVFSGSVLVIRIVPIITYLVPWYQLFSKLGLANSYTSLILCHMIVALPLIVWIMIPHFETLPLELEQSAWIDGCSRIGGFFRIVLPLSVPGILTCSIMAFIFSWNNFMFALVLASNRTRTLPMAIFQFVSYTYTDWGGIMAAATVITLPIIVISLCLQRYVVAGMTAGAVKG